MVRARQVSGLSTIPLITFEGYLPVWRSAGQPACSTVRQRHCQEVRIGVASRRVEHRSTGGNRDSQR